MTEALAAAVKRGMVPETQVLVHAGAEWGVLQQRDAEGNTLLALAAALGYTDVLRVLVRASHRLSGAAGGAGAGGKGGVSEGEGGAVSVPVLSRSHVQSKAVPLVDAANGRGETALMLAAEAEEGVGCVTLLLQARAAVDAADAGGETALIKAARHGHVQTVRLLLAKGARADLRHASPGRSQ